MLYLWLNNNLWESLPSFQLHSIIPFSYLTYDHLAYYVFIDLSSISLFYTVIFLEEIILTISFIMPTMILSFFYFVYAQSML